MTMRVMDESSKSTSSQLLVLFFNYTCWYLMASITNNVSIFHIFVSHFYIIYLYMLYIYSIWDILKCVVHLILDCLSYIVRVVRVLIFVLKFSSLPNTWITYISFPVDCLFISWCLLSSKFSILIKIYFNILQISL